jgi:hypothetical protein
VLFSSPPNGHHQRLPLGLGVGLGDVFGHGRFHFLSATLSEPKGHQLKPPSFELSCEWLAQPVAVRHRASAKVLCEDISDTP